MSRKIRNYNTYLESIGYTPVGSDDKNITFRCPLGHSTSLVLGSFANKKLVSNKNKTPLCSECFENLRRENQIRELEEKMGLKIISVDFEKRSLVYECKVCGREAKNGLANFQKANTKIEMCILCLNERNSLQKVSFENTKKVFDDTGMVMLWSREDYQKKYLGKDTLIEYRCRCGDLGNSRKQDIKRGRMCGFCKSENTARTNMAKYGVTNVSQLESSKEKARQTCIRKYGTSHHMQNPKILSKALKTSFRGRDYTFKNGRVETVLGYEDMCLREIENNYDFEVIHAGCDVCIPTIPYEHSGSRMYFPDVYLPSINTLIEVKSDYIFEIEKAKNLAKAKKSSEIYRFVLWIAKNRKSVRRLYEYDSSTDLFVAIDRIC